MKHLLVLFLLLVLPLYLVLLLPGTGIGDQPVPLYVSTGGTDAGNTCQQADHPCRTIAEAMTKVSHGAPYIIKTALGTFELQGTLHIPSQSDVTVEGGWNASFTRHSCTPAGTDLITGQHGAGVPAFQVYSTNSTEKRALTLRCLTIQPSNHYAFSNAVIIVANDAPATLAMHHVRMIGFSTGPIVALYAQPKASITATLDDTLFDHNHLSNNIIVIRSDEDSSVECTLDRVQLVNNNLQSDKSALYTQSNKTGAIATTVRNSIIAANTGGAIAGYSFKDSQNSLRMINSTITDNPRYELKISAANASTASTSLINSIVTDSYASWKDLQIAQHDTAVASLTATYCILGEHEETGGATYSSSNGVHGDPLLSATYHLDKGSVAIDAGQCGFYRIIPVLKYIRVAPYDDIDDDRRPGDQALWGCDIGADEFKVFSWPMFLPAITAPR
jgi:hypothetical protein